MADGELMTSLVLEKERVGAVLRMKNHRRHEGHMTQSYSRESSSSGPVRAHALNKSVCFEYV